MNELNEHVFPIEFISTERNREDFSDSIILTTIEYLLSLNWPIAPKPPPMVDIGTCIENFIRNIINKHQTTQNVDDKCKLDTMTSNIEVKPNIDYNQFLEVLQTILNKTSK